jgi:hypothetical protein
VAGAILAGLLLAAAALPLAAQPPARVSLAPELSEVGLGDAFEVDVQVDAVSDLAAYQFTLAFDPAIAQYARLRPGDFLSSTGRTVFTSERAGEDFVAFAAASRGSTPDAPGVSGDGILATVRFQAREVGEGALTVREVTLLDSHGADLAHTERGGAVVVRGEPTPTPPTGSATPPSPTPGGPPEAVILLPITMKNRR